MVADQQIDFRRHPVRLGRAFAGVQFADYPIGDRRITGYAKRGYWAPQTKWKKDSNEDEAFASVRFKSGQWLTLLISALDSSPRHGFLDVTGTEGSYVLDWPFNECFCQDGSQMTTQKFRNPAGEGWRYYQNVADHLTKGAELVITPNGRGVRSTFWNWPTPARGTARR